MRKNTENNSSTTYVEIEAARQSSEVLSDCAHKEMYNFTLETKHGKQNIQVPKDAFNIFLQSMKQLSKGKKINIISSEKEITTQEAADILNVSRPYLISILEKNNIPFHKTGNRRKIFLKDVISYKNKIDAKRSKILDELANEAQDLDMGY